MTLLQVGNVRFGYAGSVLFDNVTFSVAAGDRAALVAPNGAGKSTLLRIVAGEIEPDAGTAIIRRDATVGYYRQSHEVKAEGDVLSAFLSGFGDVLAKRTALHEAQEGAASGTQDALDALARAEDAYQLVRGDALEREVSILAERLGFAPKDLARPVASLSGGERGRLTLGTILAKKPELLLLDEPTNHLDLDTIGWLESYIASYRGAVVVVSHDRAFLDNVSNQTLELGSRGLRSYPLSYSAYHEARKEDLARERAVLERQQAFIDKTEDFIRKNIAGQKTKQAQSRRKMLDKLERVQGPEDVWNVAERIAFRFAPAARSGDIVLDATGLAAERGGKKLFSDVSLLIRRGEKIGIVGPNGAGKTTLLKLLAGRGDGADRGAVKRGTNLQEGYFDQHLGEVSTANTAVEEVRRVRADFTVEAARQYLARFRFWGDDPLRSVGGFSGGERSRLALAKLLLEPRNLLYLDEPTNHLDIPAAEILEEALAGFEGTVLLVSHDRRFLENVTTRVISVRPEGVDVYPGNFKELTAHRAKQAAAAAEPPLAEKKASKAPPKKPDPPPEARQSFEQQKQASREKERKKKRIKELEDLVSAGEKKLEELRAVLREDPGGDWAKLAERAKEEQSLAKRIEQMMDEWTRLSESES